jgi:hypothetical protein
MFTSVALGINEKTKQIKKHNVSPVTPLESFSGERVHRIWKVRAVVDFPNW